MSTRTVTSTCFFHYVSQLILRVRLPTIIYFLSKLSSLGFIVFSAIYQTMPISNCFHSEKALSVLYTVTISSAALLFFFQACAVFGMNRFAVVCFGVLWLAVLGGCLTTIPGITGVSIGPTRYCLARGLKPYVLAGALTPLINDTILFLAISWCLWHITWAHRTIKNSVKSMVLGDYMPSFSRSLLQDGQVYFLTTVAANILTVAMAYSTSLPVPYRTMFTGPNAVLMNIMACRVYQKTLFKLGDPRENQSSSPHHSNSIPMAPISLSLMEDSCARTKQGVNPTTDNLTVNISKTFESMV